MTFKLKYFLLTLINYYTKKIKENIIYAHEIITRSSLESKCCKQ